MSIANSASLHGLLTRLIVKYITRLIVKYMTHGVPFNIYLFSYNSHEFAKDQYVYHIWRIVGILWSRTIKSSISGALAVSFLSTSIYFYYHQIY